jgi:hypothetical protein
MMLLVNNFIIFIIALGELVRPLPINARFRASWGECILEKIIPPVWGQNFALMNGARIGSLAANVL